MTDGFISVVIPTYHRNDLLAKCLRCLAPGTQTIDASRYEVIVTDDGKTSTAEAMIREQFPWAKWVRGPQRGPAANRNNGAKHAKGEWLAFTDDDCLPSAAWLAAYKDAVNESTEVYEGRTTCVQGCQPLIEESPVNLNGGLLWSCNLMISRAAFSKLQGFDATYPFAAMEDVDFHERVHLAGYQSRFVLGATIDHPPRPKRFGVAAGKTWESHVAFYFKFKRRRSVRWWLPIHVLKIRTKMLLDAGMDRNLWKGFTSAFVEWIYVFAHVRRWERKYSLVYEIEKQS